MTNLTDFRTGLRGWIADNAIPELRRLQDPDLHEVELNLHFGAWTGGPGALQDAWLEWVRRNDAAGHICAWWPADVGGQGWTPVQQMIFTEELLAAGLPRVSRGLGEHLVAPAIFRYGTQEQKDRFLPPIKDGTDIYIQGFSEPDAGSDLAQLRCRGLVDGDELVIDGHKTWTTVGSVGNAMFLLCRTGPGERHKGISFVLIDLRTAIGVQVLPTRQMTGAAEFTEEFLDGVRVPLGNVIGGLGNGWRVTMSTLGNERAGDLVRVQAELSAMAKRVLELGRARGRLEDPALRERMATAITDVEVLRASAQRTAGVLTSGYEGEPDEAGRLLDLVASMTKVRGAEIEQDLADLAMDLLGLDSTASDDPKHAGELEHWWYRFLWSRALTIQGGTAEIQRNILAERVLGLPR
jgi:alkylation response protein AidB-like acyl-CoA dehydrogenase